MTRSPLFACQFRLFLAGFQHPQIIKAKVCCQTRLLMPAKYRFCFCYVGPLREARDPSHVILRNGMELLQIESDHTGSRRLHRCLHPGSQARTHGGGGHGARQGRRTGESSRMSGARPPSLYCSQLSVAIREVLDLSWTRRRALGSLSRSALVLPFADVLAIAVSPWARCGGTTALYGQG